MGLSILSVRVDSDDKKGFESFCNNTVMNVSTAINMFIKAVLRKQKLPFKIKTDSFEKEIYSKWLEAEQEMDSNNRQYTSDEILTSIKNKKWYKLLLSTLLVLAIK